MIWGKAIMEPFNSLKDAEIWMDQNATIAMRGLSIYLTHGTTKIRCALYWTLPNRVGGYYDNSSAIVFRLRGRLTEDYIIWKNHQTVTDAH